MSIENLVEALRLEGSDNEAVEVKAAHGGFPSDMPEIVCAFANRPTGGTIIFGLAEDSGFASVGVYDANECKRNIVAISRKAVDPIVQLTADILDFEGNSIVVAHIAEADPAIKPVSVRKSGSAYLRHFDGTYVLAEYERQMLIASRSQPRFDHEIVPDASISRDLDPDLVDSYVREVRRSSPRLADFSVEEILARTGITTPDQQLTLAGLLALGFYPQSFFPSYRVQALLTPDDQSPEGTRARDLRYFEGPITAQVDAAMNWVSQNAANGILVKNGYRHDEPTYPLTVVRELVANALVHRDYSPYSSSIMVTLRLEREQLIVTNPGGLFGFTVDSLGRVPSRSRNQLLTDIMTRVPTADGHKLIERLGTGIPSINTALDQANMHRPVFYDDGLKFSARILANRLGQDTARVPIPTLTPQSLTRKPMVSNSDRVITALSKQPLTLEKITVFTGLTPRQARYAVTQLRKAGVVEMLGEPGSKTAHYQLARASN